MNSKLLSRFFFIITWLSIISVTFANLSDISRVAAMATIPSTRDVLSKNLERMTLDKWQLSSMNTTHFVSGELSNTTSASLLSRNKDQETNFIIYLPVVTKITPGHATNFYYVDSINGSDANSGTSESKPWRTIQHAADTVAAGDTIYIRGGTYYQRVNLFNRDNSGGPYITFSNYPGKKSFLMEQELILRTVKDYLIYGIQIISVFSA